ncbi:hypothetical protein ABKV19_017014 [Rosa sericea]
MTYPKQPAHNSTGGKTPKRLLVTKSNSPTLTRKRISPKLSIALEAELMTVIQEAKHLISSPAFSPHFSSTDPVKLQGAIDIIQSILKCDIEALLDKQCNKELKEAFNYLCSIGFFDPIMVLRLDRMLNDVETELPHYKEAIDECVTGREQAKDLQHALKSLKAKLEAACATKPRIIELENELHDLNEQIEALQAQFADCQSQREALEANLDAELDKLRPEKEALQGKCKLFTAFKARLPEMKNRINAGIGVWAAFKAALNIQFRGFN